MQLRNYSSTFAFPNRGSNKFHPNRVHLQNPIFLEMLLTQEPNRVSIINMEEAIPK